MNASSRIDRLARAAPLSRLPREALLELARLSVRRELRRGQTLWRRGSKPDAFALVLVGELRVRRDGAILRAIRPDEIVGLSTTAGAPHSADVVAAEDTSVLVVQGAVLREVIRREPALALAAIAHLAEVLAQATDDALEERETTLEQRLLRRLARLARNAREVRMTHADLAKHVGASRANVTRALGRLQARGLVRVAGRGRIEVFYSSTPGTTPPP
jgi:CRP-like cAMP-binding protein